MLQVFLKSINAIPELCRLLKTGQVIAAPTETAYGLLVDSTNQQAVNKIYKIKGREKGKPLPLVADSVLQVRQYATMSTLEKKLANQFWPGPLTLVLKAKKKLPIGIITSQQTIGIRVTGDKWLRKLISVYGKPLVATSANKAEKPTLYSSQAVVKNLHKRGLKYVVDAGALKPRPVSTVAQVKNDKIIVLRQGAIKI